MLRIISDFFYICLSIFLMAYSIVFDRRTQKRLVDIKKYGRSYTATVVDFEVHQSLRVYKKHPIFQIEVNGEKHNIVYRLNAMSITSGEEREFIIGESLEVLFLDTFPNDLYIPILKNDAFMGSKVVILLAIVFILAALYDLVVLQLKIPSLVSIFEKISSFFS